ncbi:hypothetical protein EC957_007880 [Mortierella hygrophila]|uniref:Uncharacterized protein n=1 Tax=Mortierella hygrophila TaxID=979708 RepID=A0A9P6FD06_9FUNG|nr:hypothetical protein EC957_007880 [Mortierella hygrophila]
MASTASDNKTLFVVKNVDSKLTKKEVATHLGLAYEALSQEQSIHGGNSGTCAYQASVVSLDEAMAVFIKHNFTLLGDHEIFLEFRPGHIYNRIPELELVTREKVSSKAFYNALMRYGQVVSVFSAGKNHRGEYQHSVFFTTKNGAWLGHKAIAGKHLTRIGGMSVRAVGTRSIQETNPDFWAPPSKFKKPQPKGNLIGVPSNSPLANRPTGTTFIGSTPLVAKASPSVVLVSPKDVVTSSSIKLYDRTPVPSIVPAKRQHHLSKVDNTNYSSAKEQRAHIDLRKNKPILPFHISHPGDLRGRNHYEDNASQSGTRQDWYSTAFICYESLYNQSSTSDEGSLSMSTVAWGSQLDISTFQLHYGSLFVPNGKREEIPVASSMTVEMRQYGDKESAAEVLAIRNDGYLPSIAKAMREGANVASRGKIMSMKSLESGHLVTSSLTNSRQKGLYLWDMKGEAEDAMIPLVKLSTEQSGAPWIDAKGMDVCSVDSYGVINSYDLTKAVNSYRGLTTTVENAHTTTIDNEYSFHSTCISLNALDSTILVGSGEVAQIACWDTRSPTAATTTSFACQYKSSTSSGLRSFDPIYGIEWNPLKSSEFMTVHPHTIRVWDTRKMNNDAYATFHNMGSGETLRKALWNPRRPDIIASLSVAGQVKIWKLNKFDCPADPTTLVQKPELLFVHRGQDLEAEKPP